ncbi:MAG: hypothetical protein ACQEQO_11305, partial [Thermodesulfobacteriota bacterium]
MLALVVPHDCGEFSIYGHPLSPHPEMRGWKWLMNFSFSKSSQKCRFLIPFFEKNFFTSKYR